MVCAFIDAVVTISVPVPLSVPVGFDPREAIGLYQRLRRAEDLKKEPGNHLEDAGVCSNEIRLDRGMLAPALFTIDRMRTIEARVEMMSELYESRKPLPETYAEFAARWYSSTPLRCQSSMQCAQRAREEDLGGITRTLRKGERGRIK